MRCSSLGDGKARCFWLFFNDELNLLVAENALQCALPSRNDPLGTPAARLSADKSAGSTTGGG
jgi:hypothetical protein